MKHVLLSLAVAVLGLAAAAQATPAAPDFLRPGDKVAILSLASTPKPEQIDAGMRTLKEWGYVPVVGRHALTNYHDFAGTPRQRLDDLMKALRDPEIKAILCSRGGYGSAMMLELIHPDTLARYPKWIVGYSDITSMHSAFVRAGIMSIHGNMCGALNDPGVDRSIHNMLRDVLAGSLPSYTVPAHPSNHPGTATGIVLGGNMAVLSVNFSGSAEWDFLDRDYIAGRDIILFFEDVGESINRVGSMLTQLRLKGVLGRVKGIIVGRFTDYKPANGYADMNEMLAERLRDLDIPICFDFPAGHDETWNYPLIEGCPATLTVGADSVGLRFHR